MTIYWFSVYICMIIRTKLIFGEDRSCLVFCRSTETAEDYQLCASVSVAVRRTSLSNRANFEFLEQFWRFLFNLHRTQQHLFFSFLWVFIRKGSNDFKTPWVAQQRFVIAAVLSSQQRFQIRPNLRTEDGKNVLFTHNADNRPNVLTYTWLQKVSVTEPHRNNQQMCSEDEADIRDSYCPNTVIRVTVDGRISNSTIWKWLDKQRIMNESFDLNAIMIALRPSSCHQCPDESEQMLFVVVVAAEAVVSRKWAYGNTYDGKLCLRYTQPSNKGSASMSNRLKREESAGKATKSMAYVDQRLNTVFYVSDVRFERKFMVKNASFERSPYFLSEQLDSICCAVVCLRNEGYFIEFALINFQTDRTG